MSPRARARLVREVSPLVVTLIAVTTLAVFSVNLSARIGRFAVSQEVVPVEEAPAPFPVDSREDKGIDQRSEAERQIEDLHRHYQDRDRELAQNFRGTTVDLGEIRAAMARWKEGIDALSSVLSSGTLEDFWDQNSDFYENYQQPVDEAFQRAYDSMVYMQLEQDFKNSDRQLKSMKSDLKRFQKDLKGAPELGQLEAFVKAYESNLAMFRGQFASLDRSDTEAAKDFQADLYDALSTEDFYDIAETLHEAANAAQVKREAKRQIKETNRSIKNQARQVKRLKKYGSTEALEAILTERKALLTEIEGLLKQAPFDVEAYLDANEAMADLEQEVWDLISELSERENLVRQGKDAKRLLREKERNLKELKRECKRAKCQGMPREELIKEFEAILKEMKESATAQDYDEFFSLNDDADDLTRRFWEETSGAESADLDPKEFKRSIKEVERRIRKALTAGAITQDQAAPCFDFLGQARGIAEQMEAAKGDKGKLEALTEQLTALGEQWNAQCEGIVEGIVRE